MLAVGRREAVALAATVAFDTFSLRGSTMPSTFNPIAAAGVRDVPLGPAVTDATAAAADPVAALAVSDTAPEAVAAAGQTGSRRLMSRSLGGRRQLLQTCPPANPCLVSVCLKCGSGCSQQDAAALQSS